MAKKSSLKDKELTKLKKLIKKLKEAKKTKRKRKRDEGITQKVSQKIIFGSNLKGKSETDNVGRSFPIIQFLPQNQPQNLDTQLLRDLLLQKNMSPLTRPVESRVPYRQLYDLGDQYGLVDNPVSLGVPLDIQSEISSLTDINEFGDTSMPLQLPPEKQGNLDEPLKDPNPIDLGTDEMTKMTDLSSKQLTKTTKDLFNPPEDISKAETVTKIKEKKKKKKKNIEFIIDNPEQEEILLPPEEIEMKEIQKKKIGRPKGSKTKAKDDGDVPRSEEGF